MIAMFVTLPKSDSGLSAVRRILAVAVLLLSSAVFVSDRADAAPLPPLGVHAATLQMATNYEAWLGRNVSHVTDFIEGSSWAQIRQLASERTFVWGSTRYQAVYGLQPFPNGGSFAVGNTGAYDADLLSVAQIIAAADPDAIIRPAWEHNGNWFEWNSISDPVGYANYFARLVNIFRSVPGQQFRFEWNVSLSPAATNVASYPGDAYVDFIGLDVYDSSWGPHEVDPVVRWNLWLDYATGFNFHRNFANLHGKPMAISEWSLSEQHFAGDNPDNPYFIQKFHDWISANSSSIAYVNQLDTVNHQGSFSLSSPVTPFPNSAALFLQLFGNGQSAPPPTTTTAPPTTTTPPTTATPPTTTTTTATTTTATTAAPTTTAPVVAQTTTIPPTTTPAAATTSPPAASPPSTSPPAAAPGTTSPPAAVTPAPGAKTDVGNSGPARGPVCVDDVNPAPRPRAGSASGYWVLADDGTVQSFGSARHHGDLASIGVTVRAVALESTPSGDGYWILAANNRVYAFGAAGAFGDASGLDLVGGIVDIGVDPANGGYWLAGSDGGVFAFRAPFRGSLGAIGLRAPIAAISSSNRGTGYWMVGTDGGVFAFGDVGFFGSTGGIALDQPISSLAPHPDDRGYWLHAVDGGVFAFGVPFHGSIPGMGLCTPPEAIQLRSTQTGGGYWILAADGRVFPFGDATHHGDMVNLNGRQAVDLVVAP